MKNKIMIGTHWAFANSMYILIFQGGESQNFLISKFKRKQNEKVFYTTITILIRKGGGGF